MCSTWRSASSSARLSAKSSHPSWPTFSCRPSACCWAKWTSPISSSISAGRVFRVWKLPDQAGQPPHAQKGRGAGGPDHQRVPALPVADPDQSDPLRALHVGYSIAFQPDLPRPEDPHPAGLIRPPAFDELVKVFWIVPPANRGSCPHFAGGTIFMESSACEQSRCLSEKLTRRFRKIIIHQPGPLKFCLILTMITN
ncbi:MAG: hypothetical protein H6R38_340 [Deltaproteobacteria bacterium]|nr:hypothetical protein [Deltaproteobacteria bacterium]